MLTALEANPDGEQTPHLTPRQKAPCGIPACTTTPAWASHSEGQAGGNRSVRAGSAHSSSGHNTHLPTRGSGSRARGRGSGRGRLQRSPADRGSTAAPSTRRPQGRGRGLPHRAPPQGHGRLSLSRTRKATGSSARRAQQRNAKPWAAGTAPPRCRPSAGSALLR